MNQQHQHQSLPTPIVREPRAVDTDGSELAFRTDMGDYINLTTGKFEIARIIDGRRWDTRTATLVAGSGSQLDGLSISRLYRVSQHEYFHVYFKWVREWAFIERPVIKVIEYIDVFDTAMELILREDLYTFLRDWQLPGWLPYDFGAAKGYVEMLLPADDYERLFNRSVVAGSAVDDSAKSG